MPEIPAGAKKPKDHLAPETEPEVTEDELLATLPQLTPPHKLRLRQRNKIMAMAARLNGLTDDDGGIEVEPGDPAFVELLDVLADVDDFAETIATDSAAYIDWSHTASYEQFGALLTRYASAVGESAASSN